LKLIWTLSTWKLRRFSSVVIASGWLSVLLIHFELKAS
jgi:hypothetical protein